MNTHNYNTSFINAPHPEYTIKIQQNIDKDLSDMQTTLNVIENLYKENKILEAENNLKSYMQKMNKSYRKFFLTLGWDKKTDKVKFISELIQDITNSKGDLSELRQFSLAAIRAKHQAGRLTEQQRTEEIEHELTKHQTPSPETTKELHSEFSKEVLDVQREQSKHSAVKIVSKQIEKFFKRNQGKAIDYDKMRREIQKKINKLFTKRGLDNPDEFAKFIDQLDYEICQRQFCNQFFDIEDLYVNYLVDNAQLDINIKENLEKLISDIVQHAHDKGVTLPDKVIQMHIQSLIN